MNISSIQFKEANFCQTLQQIILESGIEPHYLELELTESGIMSQAEHAINSLSELRQLGVKLAIDDFGTGYSCLSYLRNFPIDRIKIDQSFIRDIETTVANAAIVDAILALAESLGLKTVAEGVENQAELDYLRQHNCQEVQGYYFAKPMNADNFLNWYQQMTNS